MLEVSNACSLADSSRAEYLRHMGRFARGGRAEVDLPHQMKWCPGYPIPYGVLLNPPEEIDLHA